MSGFGAESIGEPNVGRKVVRWALLGVTVVCAFFAVRALLVLKEGMQLPAMRNLLVSLFFMFVAFVTRAFIKE